MSKNAVSKVEKQTTDLAVPSFLKDYAGMGVEGVDNVKEAKPSIRLMHPLSAPVVNGEARPGDFCHIVNKTVTVLGQEIIAVPVYSETGWALWDPSNNQTGPLARGAKVDGRWVWNPSHTKFEVRGRNGLEVWNTAGSIEESGLTKWKGSGADAVPPPAKESINMLFALPEMGDDWHGIMSFQKSSFPIARRMVSTIMTRSKAAPSFAQKYRIGSTLVTAKNGNKHLVPTFEFVGIVDDESLVRKYYDSYSYSKENGLYNNDQSDEGGEVGDYSPEGQAF